MATTSVARSWTAGEHPLRILRSWVSPPADRSRSLERITPATWGTTANHPSQWRVGRPPLTRRLLLVSHRRPMGDVMQQSFATVLAAALAALAMTGCGSQQPVPEVSSSQQLAPEESSAQPTAPLPSTRASASVSATASLSSELPAEGNQQPDCRPRTILRSRGDLSSLKFPGLPRVQSLKGAATEPTTTRMCAYMAVVGDLSAPAATLGAVDWSGASDESLMMKRVCTGDDELTPSVTKIDGDWVHSLWMVRVDNDGRRLCSRQCFALRLTPSVQR